MSCIDAKEVHKRKAVSPAQKEKSARQYRHHRQNINHEINKEIARRILYKRNKHFSWMLRKIPYPISMKSHKADRHIFAVPSEELQDSPAIPISMPHKHAHKFSNIYVLYQPLDFGFLFLCHRKTSFCL